MPGLAWAGPRIQGGDGRPLQPTPHSRGTRSGAGGLPALPLKDEKGSGGGTRPRRVVRKEMKEEEVFAWQENENFASQCFWGGSAVCLALF